MQRKTYPWNLEAVTDIKARAVMVREALTKELEARGIEPAHAMPTIQEGGYSWASKGPRRLVITIGLYPDAKKTMREPKRGFDLAAAAEFSVLAYQRALQRRKDYEDKNTSFANYDQVVKRLKERYALPDNIRMYPQSYGISIDFSKLSEAQAEALLLGAVSSVHFVGVRLTVEDEFDAGTLETGAGAA